MDAAREALAGNAGQSAPLAAAEEAVARGVQYREMRIPEVDRASISLLDGDTVLLTTPARTAVDVARLHGARHGAVAMDSFLHQFGPGARAELEATVRGLAREKGIAHARRGLAHAGWIGGGPAFLGSRPVASRS